MDNIDRMIFQDVYGLFERGFDCLWQGITPFEAECMTYDEAVAWLGKQINNEQ